MEVKNIQASEIYFAVNIKNKDKYPVIIYAKEYETDNEYKIKGDMTLEQVKSYYEIFKRIIEKSEKND